MINSNEQNIQLPVVDNLLEMKPKFLPPSLPNKFLERVSTFHGDPFVWWSGQILTYIMRFNDDFLNVINNKTESLKFSGSPCVGY